MDHIYKGVQAKPDGFVAHCSCGWRSRLVRTAGTAGTVWDQHAGLVHEGPGPATLWVSVVPEPAPVVTISGELDISTAEQFKREVADLPKGGVITVLMPGVGFVDSTGLGALVHLGKACIAAGGRLRLGAVPERVRRTIEMSGLAEVLLD